MRISVYLLVLALTSGLAAPADAASPVAISMAPRLFLSTEGVQLSAFPSRRVVRRGITVSRTLGSTAVPWTATSDQPWLTVTPSGMTDQTLIVKANPASLPFDAIQLATVTVTTTNSEFSDTQRLRVGMWRGTSDPPIIVDTYQTTYAIAMNPVRPLVYVSDAQESVYVYNVYSGEKVATFNRVAPWVGQMTLSGDGSVLYVTDMTNYRIVVLDAVTGAHLGRYYAIGYPVDLSFQPVYVRPYGQPALLSPGGPMIAIPSGARLTAQALPYALLGAAPNGKRVYALGSQGPLAGYSVQLVDGKLSFKSLGFGSPGENCNDLAISNDGQRVYTACARPHGFNVFNGRTLSLMKTIPIDTETVSFPANVEIAPDGNLATEIDAGMELYDVFVYDAQGSLLGKVHTQHYPNGGAESGLMKLSPDGTRVITLTYPDSTDLQTLRIRNMP